MILLLGQYICCDNNTSLHYCCAWFVFGSVSEQSCSFSYPVYRGCITSPTRAPAPIPATIATCFQPRPVHVEIYRTNQVLLCHCVFRPRSRTSTYARVCTYPLVTSYDTLIEPIVQAQTSAAATNGSASIAVLAVLPAFLPSTLPVHPMQRTSLVIARQETRDKINTDAYAAVGR